MPFRIGALAIYDLNSESTTIFQFLTTCNLLLIALPKEHPTNLLPALMSLLRYGIL